MKEWKKRAWAFVLAGALFLGNDLHGQAEYIIQPSMNTYISETKPYNIKTGDTDELEKKNHYTITASEEEKEDIIVPIAVSGAGLLIYNLEIEQSVVTQGSITATITSDIEGKEPIEKAITKQVKKTTDEKYVFEDKKVYLPDEGIYYMHISVSKELCVSEEMYNFVFDMQMISSEDRTLKNKKVIKAYQCEKDSCTYYKFNVKKDGYITVETLYDEEECGEPVITLCNKNKKKISMSCSNNILTENKTVFAVKKGNYFIKVEDIKGEYQIQAKFTKVDDNSGKTKQKAKDIKLGKKLHKGTIFVDNKIKAYDWYKFTLDKEMYVYIDFGGSTSGDNQIKLEIIPPKIAEFKKNAILTFNGINGTGAGSSGDKWPAGTYYIRVNKTKGKGSGTYYLGVNRLK